MSEKRNILIIENQYTQFCEIHNNLGTEYDIFPNSKQDDYIEFIDKVRVWVNEEYEKVLKNAAISKIKQYITSNNIELILMDHILGGAHHCKTGIDLAYEINEPRKNKDQIIPVLFLSKTKSDDIKKELGGVAPTGINKYEEDFGESNYIWVHKGYFGDEIRNEAYFDVNVLPKIKKLIGYSKRQKFWNALDKILDCDFPANQNQNKKKLEKIKEDKDFNNLNPALISHIFSIATKTPIYLDHLKLDKWNYIEK